MNSTYKLALSGVCLLALTACGGSSTPPETEEVPEATTPATTTPTTPTTTLPNAAPPPTSGGPGSLGGPGSSAAPFPAFTETTSDPSTATILTFDTGTSAVGQTTGTYTHSTSMLAVATQGVTLETGGNRYVGIISGAGAGDNRVAALATPTADMPTSAGASYSGTANMAYLDTPSAQTFRGTMDATITAAFGAGTTGRVGIELSNPNGTFGGTAYNGAGAVSVTDMVISDNVYSAQSGTTTGSITGFAGAAGLNSGAQTVTGLGVFAGPGAEETGAVLHISDGANGLANITVTGR